MAYQTSKTIPAPQRVPEGFLLSVEMSDRKRGLAFSIFGFIWTAFIVLMMVLVVRDSAYIGVFFLSLFLAIGLCLLGVGLWYMLISIRLYPAELILPKYPLRLGETCPIHYRRRLRGGTFTKPGNIEVQLVCDEWVQYKQGTDTKTKTHSLYEVQLPECSIVTGERQADYESQVEISAEAPPSFSAEHNRVRWRVIVKLKVPGIPRTCESEFLLKVVPEVMLA